MENEMIDRVARAIWDDLPHWESQSEEVKDEVRKEARAAIAAMRVPTAAMLRAMKIGPYNAYDRFEVAETYGTIGVDPDKCAEIYTAMIDAILKSE